MAHCFVLIFDCAVSHGIVVILARICGSATTSDAIILHYIVLLHAVKLHNNSTPSDTNYRQDNDANKT